jgi:hypothetical protein
MSTLRVLLVIPLLLVAAAFLGISAAIILRGRPLLLRGRLLYWALFVIWAPLAVAMLLVAFSVSEAAMTCIALFQIGAAALIILAARRAMRGYLIIGISENMFRESLQSALTRLGLPFQESVIGFTLPSLHETLRTSLAPRLGSAQFQMESSGSPEVLAQIAKRVEEHLRADPEPPSMVAPDLRRGRAHSPGAGGLPGGKVLSAAERWELPHFGRSMAIVRPGGAARD